MENLIVYQKMLELTEYAYIALRQFPKSEKFTLAADIKNQIYTVLRLIIATNKRYHKKTTMSWVAHCKHADTYRLRKKVLEDFVLIRETLFKVECLRKEG